MGSSGQYDVSLRRLAFWSVLLGSMLLAPSYALNAYVFWNAEPGGAPRFS